MRFNRSRNFIAIVLLAFFANGCSTYKISERQWISTLQTKTGSIALSNDREVIHPYFTNLAVWALLKTDPAPREVELAAKWINWYLDHLNGPGPGLAVGGSIYDYKIINGIETATRNYDSVDSYAATFLMLVNQYFQVTHQKAFVDLRLPQLLMVVDAIQAMFRGPLTVARPDTSIAYLMDNVEVWRGLHDFSILMTAIGQKEKATEIAALARQVQDAIEDRLWVQKLNVYLPFDGSIPNVDAFYPDATAMLWPILFDLPEARSRKTKLWNEFKQKFKRKWQAIKVDSFSWSFIAYLAERMGDQETAKTWENNLYKPYQRNWPWHIGESAGYLLYLNKK